MGEQTAGVGGRLGADGQAPSDQQRVRSSAVAYPGKGRRLGMGGRGEVEQALGILEEAQRLGFLGPGPAERHVWHSLGYWEAVGDVPPARGVDLGSGGGVPGLLLALRCPATRWVLLDSSERRTEFLTVAVRALELADRVTVVTERAETYGRDPAVRGQFDLVVARGFGAPAVTAECGAPLLETGGRLVVSEPPNGREEQWKEVDLSALNLRDLGEVRGRFRYRVLESVGGCPVRFPRRVGVPAKRPLLRVSRETYSA